ncbi:MAG: AbrB/MazE/SpoVT family DNA-binding domain-containing protein [Methylobacterium sp.]|jgi:AbrB family looped-hinge helix DNA binding protein|nr:AbrB/MazE/SpoVT family DNA-binding domain-containing protein [Methylobacterium sp.]MCA3604724.1 AbrB/MazE/SpoVT family DNA-binding domain-containing protein [Methylobacterium sp.]MCA3616436.1 AbrB/MazE/SpoVT family DNA-binding domain-containing protein [Methylobacterium sp.]MCA3625156.1 AbrB/MazE/SpoVT family DNA-binding domain-containing protein [Methylobacterium sp.]
MSVGIVTSKGQITIPVAIREIAGLEPGVQIEFVIAPDGVIHLLPLNGTAEAFFEALQGSEKTDFSGRDDEAIAEALRENVPFGPPVNKGRGGERKSRAARSKAGTKAA